MTKSGTDRLKHRARAIARATGRRYPDILRELRTGSGRHAPSKALVPVCSGDVGPWGGPARCRRPAGHPGSDDPWTGTCSSDPHHCPDIEAGYRQARAEAGVAAHEAWLASMSPTEREQYEQAMEDEYAAELAAEAADAYDRDEERYWEAVHEADAEERWAAEAEADGVDFYDDGEGYYEDDEAEFDYSFEER
ncbi:hypothetical protein ACFVHW_04180 [Streptomyces sp. NPDC127110]|uniref:hypothetical protein n=1 Tax=Streptomyces sp. NPDC127110 TaxID=3345362 RepID=UPI00362A6A60